MEFIAIWYGHSLLRWLSLLLGICKLNRAQHNKRNYYWMLTNFLTNVPEL